MWYHSHAFRVPYGVFQKPARSLVIWTTLPAKDKSMWAIRHIIFIFINSRYLHKDINKLFDSISLNHSPGGFL